MYLDEINFFAKNDSEMETLIQTVRIYSQDIEMEFGIEKCALLLIQIGKRYITEWINHQIKKKSVHSEKKKPTNTWDYWKLTS